MLIKGFSKSDYFPYVLKMEELFTKMPGLDFINKIAENGQCPNLAEIQDIESISESPLRKEISTICRNL